LFNRGSLPCTEGDDDDEEAGDDEGIGDNEQDTTAVAVDAVYDVGCWLGDVVEVDPGDGDEFMADAGK
jgi:hypothetical protein